MSTAPYYIEDHQVNFREQIAPLISVILITYNRNLLLKEAIMSVQHQTYPNWELVIVDDGSDDGTVEMIHQLNDKRIHLIELPHSGHIGKLFNKGVEQSNGDWLSFFNSDDLWLPGKLESQMRQLKKDKKKWVYGGLELMDEELKTIPNKSGKFVPLPGWIVENLLKTNITVTICSITMEKKLFYEAGKFSEDPRLVYRGDYELILRVALKAEATVVPETVVRVREHAGRITRLVADPFERSALAYTVFLDHRPKRMYRKMARRARAFHFAEASVRRFKLGEYRKACSLLARALWDGDCLRHWLSSLKRGIYALGKKYF